MAFEKYGFIDGKIKKALTANRRELQYENRADKISLRDRISMLEDRLINQTLPYSKIVDIQEELKMLRG